MKNREVPLVDLFPYKIKNVNLFYYRNHPEDTHPDSKEYFEFYSKFIEFYIEGYWVNDTDGKGNSRWVYMYPSLFHYINYSKIQFGKSKKLQFPDLRDNEWIIHTYTFILRGFSGFELDDEYSCNELVDLAIKGELDEIEKLKLSSYCYNKKGDLKKYINAWDYLTKGYLFNSVNMPLGLPLYENEYKHGMILTSRSIGKSSNIFVGELGHSFLTSEVLYLKDLREVNKKLLYGIGAVNSTTLKRSLSNFRTSYEQLPSQYVYQDASISPFKGAFYKNLQGEWQVGKQLQHIVKHSNNKPKILGNILQSAALVTENLAVFTGDRLKLIVVEEVGLFKEVLQFHGLTTDSMKDMGESIGRIIYLGTSGDIDKVRGSKKMFDNPKAYGIFGIPNYWKNSNKEIGLFIPMEYALKDYKDANGNTNLELSRAKVLNERVKFKQSKDSKSYAIHVMNNPISPDEILSTSSNLILPKSEAANQLQYIEDNNLFNLIATVGKFSFSYNSKTEVTFINDSNLIPILTWGDEDKYENKDGAWIIYEDIDEGIKIPNNVYYILYDPAAQSGEGTSLHSVLVYKHFGFGTYRYDTIVAEWIGRKPTLELNYQEVIKAAKYFNALIFPEIVTAGFVDWCERNYFSQFLHYDPKNLDAELRGESYKSSQRYGTKINERNKNWALERLGSWLTEVKSQDEVSGKIMIRTIDWIFSPRILNEIINYNSDDNFDHISSLILLMILLGEIEQYKEEEVILPEKENKSNDYFINPNLLRTEKRRRISKFSSY